MKLSLILFISLASILQKEELTQDIKEGNIKIDLPNDSWFLSGREAGQNTTVYIFKRKAVGDSEGRQIIPNMAVIVEDIDKDLDAVAYSALKRSKVPFKVLGVFTHHDGLLTYKNAVGYKGAYTDQKGLEHMIFVIHATNGHKGLQIICDATTDILKKIESEFLITLKSIRNN